MDCMRYCKQPLGRTANNCVLSCHASGSCDRDGVQKVGEMRPYLDTSHFFVAVAVEILGVMRPEEGHFQFRDLGISK